MKKVAFVVVLVAAIVGMVFGGLSVASAGFFDPTPHPTCTPKPSPTPAPTPCCDTTLAKIDALSLQVSNLQKYLGNVSMTESGEGQFNGTVNSGTINAVKLIERSNPQVRHVHVTYLQMNCDPMLGVSIDAGLDEANINHITFNNGCTMGSDDFDASYWHILIFNNDPGFSEKDYEITVTWTEIY